MIVTAPLDDVVARYVSVSPALSSDAFTVAVIAPVSVFGELHTTLEMTGAEFAAVALAVLAVRAAAGPVDTETAGATAVFDTPNSRRAAARTIQDTGDSIGAPVPEPSSGDGTEATAAGIGTMAAGAVDTGAAITRAAVRTLVAVCDAAVRRCVAAAAGNLTRAEVSSTGNAAGFAFRWGAGCDGVAVETESLPRFADTAVVGRSTDRFARVPSGRRVVSEWTAESALAWESDVSAGEAQANPAPPETTAAPIPSATARPPTRPTWADARITLNLPTGLQSYACRNKMGKQYLRKA